MGVCLDSKLKIFGIGGRTTELGGREIRNLGELFVRVCLFPFHSRFCDLLSCIPSTLPPFIVDGTCLTFTSRCFVATCSRTTGRLTGSVCVRSGEGVRQLLAVCIEQCQHVFQSDEQPKSLAGTFIRLGSCQRSHFVFRQRSNSRSDKTSPSYVPKLARS